MRTPVLSLLAGLGVVAMLLLPLATPSAAGQAP